MKISGTICGRPVRVRFAPSPTGQVHVGNIRTAIFNWLYARGTEGKFLVRVEDTDRERSTSEAVEKLFECMSWLGLDYDEEPIFQSGRLSDHVFAAERLLREGKAYKGFHEQAQGVGEPTVFKIPWETDGNPSVRTRGEVAIDVSPEEKLTIDFRGLTCSVPGKNEKPMPFSASLAGFHGLRLFSADGRMLFDMESALDGIFHECKSHEFFKVSRMTFERREVFFDDMVKGTLSKPLDTMKDLVVLRSDGSPVFHLANVCDDIAQQITCVIRGDDHIENTYRHIFLFQALSSDAPSYAHLPMIVNDSGKPYSKRDGNVFAGEFREQGFLPDALFNFLALLGWSPGDGREKMTKPEMAAAFSLPRVLGSPAKFDIAKLAKLNGQYIAEMTTQHFIDTIAGFAKETARERVLQWMLNHPAKFAKAATLMQIRTRILSDCDEWGFFFPGTITYDPKALRKNLREDSRDAIEALRVIFAEFAADEFSAERLEAATRGLEGSRGLKEGLLNRPLRVAVTGRDSGPDLMLVLEMIGKHEVLDRLAALPPAPPLEEEEISAQKQWSTPSG
ncbi:MAG: glutamate--tRNA ligase [Victivallales bacterium]|nr:glutamate--tRNA ligase [Victivallales bacterium]